MTSPAETIAFNLRKTRERIAETAEAAGRTAGEIQLVGVSKYVDAFLTQSLLAAGCTDLGESRPQQLWEKATFSGLEDARWHLIGHLQRNKVERTLPLTSMIHSVDSLRLLRSVEEHAVNLDLWPKVLLEVNTTGETVKHGFSPQELRSVVSELEWLERAEICGLMTMSSLSGGEQAAERHFCSLRDLRDELRSLNLPGISLHELSMGMSGDFEVAIRCGATLVRIGSLLFEGLAL